MLRKPNLSAHNRGRYQTPFTVTVFERVFKEFGVPGAIRTDNGLPFASPNALYGIDRRLTSWRPLATGDFTHLLCAGDQFAKKSIFHGYSSQASTRRRSTLSCACVSSSCTPFL